MTYNYEHEYIKDDLYYTIAAAADKLYADYMQELALNLVADQLAAIDAQVERDGTSEANDMLSEIFNKQS